MSEHQAPEVQATGLSPKKLTTTTRDSAELGRRIEAWLAGTLSAGADPSVCDVVKPEGNGMSSETLLFTARYADGGAPVERRFVARIEPELDKVPVFPTYDLRLQFDVMSLVSAATDVPVPETFWFEADAGVIGAPFFVMERIDGEVPRDVLPYTFPDPNWVIDATPEQRAKLQRSAVTALAGIHEITPESHDLAFLQYDEPGATSLERHLASWERYHEWVVADGEPSPLLAECMTWLRDHLPKEGVDTGPPRLSWGDARIGNMMFVDHEVVAVLDWEMAGVAPPEVDLGWMTYLHRFFQDLTTSLGAEGIPDMMRPVDARATYAEASGRDVGDLTWHLAYAAMRHGIIMRRVTERSILFGEAVRPEDPDEMIIHRATLRAMLDGSYWDTVAL
ncbi:MAG TPA: phosphotransferase family protein [Aquihabitans sp.]|jgi:aminoglycoside phosphotransferase (APT) family kinase protein|nr:phosphotransferase family protein [Aquihabitans sp.]